MKMVRTLLCLFGLVLLSGSVACAAQPFYTSIQQGANGEDEYTFTVQGSGSNRHIEINSYQNGVVGKIFDTNKFDEAVFRVHRGEKQKVGSSYVKDGIKCSWEVKRLNPNDYGMLVTTRYGKKKGVVAISGLDDSAAFQMAVNNAK
ncbi:hypothetical protein [Aminomonas paucivorans]|uniref:hypothetical protein n=1 Tax=Aminomonas paucivorans TaxID=81412 RepID=UPI00332F2566